MILRKYVLLLILIFTVSCQGQDNKTNTPEKKEVELFSKTLIKYEFKNSEENFKRINKKLLDINSENLKEGYNQIIIFNEPINYQISRDAKYIKIGNDILPDIDKIKEDDLLTYSYMKSVVSLNKILYQNDLNSMSTVKSTDIDLAWDLVIFFNYENSEPLMKYVSENIGDLNEDPNFWLAIIFYNRGHATREKLLRYLSKDQNIINSLTYYLSANKDDIIINNGITNKEIDSALSFLENLRRDGH